MRLILFSLIVLSVNRVEAVRLCPRFMSVIDGAPGPARSSEARQTGNPYADNLLFWQGVLKDPLNFATQLGEGKPVAVHDLAFLAKLGSRIPDALVHHPSLQVGRGRVSRSVVQLTQTHSPNTGGVDGAENMGLSAPGALEPVRKILETLFVIQHGIELASRRRGECGAECSLAFSLAANELKLVINVLIRRAIELRRMQMYSLDANRVGNDLLDQARPEWSLPENLVLVRWGQPGHLSDKIEPPLFGLTRIELDPAKTSADAARRFRDAMASLLLRDYGEAAGGVLQLWLVENPGGLSNTAMRQFSLGATENIPTPEDYAKWKKISRDLKTRAETLAIEGVDRYLRSLPEYTGLIP